MRPRFGRFYRCTKSYNHPMAKYLFARAGWFAHLLTAAFVDVVGAASGGGARGSHRQPGIVWSAEVEKHRSGSRRPLDGGRGERGAAERVPTWARPAAACGRRPTAASRGSRSPTARSTSSSIGAVAVAPVEPGHRLHRHRRVRDPRQHHPGRRRLQVHRRRQDVDAHRPRRHAGHLEDPRPPDQPRPRLRRRVRPSRGAESRSRRLPVEGRRQDVGQDPVPRQQDRRASS